MATYTIQEYQNLADGADEKKLAHIGDLCKSEYENDLSSREEWDRMVADWVKLFFMQDKPKNPPWEGSSDESVPMLLEACNQSHARAYGEMFQQPRNRIVTAVPTGIRVDPMIRQRIERVSAHMSYQLLIKMSNYRTDKDRLLLANPLYGCMFTKTYYDYLHSRIAVDTIRPTDLVVPYGTGPRAIEDLPRKSQRIFLPKHKAAYLARRGYFISAPTTTNDDEHVLPVDAAADDAGGITHSSLMEDNCFIVEQHRFLDLDGDGYEEPYIVTFDGTTGKVLRIAIRYDVDAEGLPTNYKEPVEYYTDYHFIPNPNGFYGLGYGILLSPINTAVNKLLRQIIDAGTLQNVGNMSGFIDRRVNAPAGQVKLALGKFIRTESSMEDIAKGIYQFKFPGPSSVNAEVLRMLTLRGDRLAMVTETITGQAERVMQPTTVLALIEQANVIFSSTHARTLESWKKELNKIYRLNWKHTAEQEQFVASFATMSSVGVPSADPVEITISRLDYAPDMKIVPVADPKASTKQERMARSDAEFQTALQCPFVQNDPIALYNVFHRRFESIGCDNIQEILPPPPIDPVSGLPVMPGQAALQPAGIEDDKEFDSNTVADETTTPAVQTPVQQQGEML